MVTFTRVSKTEDTLVEQLEEHGVTVTHRDADWEHREDGYRPVRWEIEGYVPESEVTAEREDSLRSIVEKTGWHMDFRWDVPNDPDGDRGILFERFLG